MNENTPSLIDGVSLSQAQKDLLSKDLNLIDSLQSEANNLEDLLRQAEGDVANARAQRLACDSMNQGTARKNCITGRDADWNAAANRRDQYSNSLTSKNAQIVVAKKNYNDDLDSIQNSIKLQIQANLANSQSQTQAIQNQVSLQQNDPRLLLQKNQLEAENKLKAIELQATLDKQKKEASTKIVIFVVITLAVVLVGFVVIKKLFV